MYSCQCEGRQRRFPGPTALNYLTAVKTRGSLTLYKKAIAFCEGMKSFLLPRATRGIRDGAKKECVLWFLLECACPRDGRSHARFHFQRRIRQILFHWWKALCRTIENFIVADSVNVWTKELNRIKLLMRWWPFKWNRSYSQKYFHLLIFKWK